MGVSICQLRFASAICMRRVDMEGSAPEEHCLVVGAPDALASSPWPSGKVPDVEYDQHDSLCSRAQELG